MVLFLKIYQLSSSKYYSSVVIKLIVISIVPFVVVWVVLIRLVIIFPLITIIAVFPLITIVVVSPVISWIIAVFPLISIVVVSPVISIGWIIGINNVSILLRTSMPIPVEPISILLLVVDPSMAVKLVVVKTEIIKPVFEPVLSVEVVSHQVAVQVLWLWSLVFLNDIGLRMSDVNKVVFPLWTVQVVELDPFVAVQLVVVGPYLAVDGFQVF